jgi:hypothetical protein
VEYAGDDVHKVPLNALVWEIQETREVFADYEAYLKRLGYAFRQTGPAKGFESLLCAG